MRRNLTRILRWPTGECPIIRDSSARLPWQVKAYQLREAEWAGKTKDRMRCRPQGDVLKAMASCELGTKKRIRAKSFFHDRP